MLIALQRDTTTMSQLAAEFGCSRKTIKRDIEALLKLGVPIMTRRGLYGGVTLDRPCLPPPDAEAIVREALAAPAYQDASYPLVMLALTDAGLQSSRLLFGRRCTSGWRRCSVISKRTRRYPIPLGRLAAESWPAEVPPRRDGSHILPGRPHETESVDCLCLGCHTRENVLHVAH